MTIKIKRTSKFMPVIMSDNICYECKKIIYPGELYYHNTEEKKSLCSECRKELKDVK